MATNHTLSCKIIVRDRVLYIVTFRLADDISIFRGLETFRGMLHFFVWYLICFAVSTCWSILGCTWSQWGNLKVALVRAMWCELLGIVLLGQENLGSVQCSVTTSTPWPFTSPQAWPHGFKHDELLDNNLGVDKGSVILDYLIWKRDWRHAS